MQSLTEISNEAIREYKGGRITPLLADPVINVFRVLSDQKNELQRLKIETLSHVWATEKAGKIEMVPLDDEFGRIKSQIDVMVGKILINTGLVDALDKTFTEMAITPPLAAHEERVRNIREEIERQTQELNGKLVPYRAAAQMAHADLDKIPEVVELRQNSAKSVAALEGDAQAIDAKLARISEILQGLAR